MAWQPPPPRPRPTPPRPPDLGRVLRELAKYRKLLLVGLGFLVLGWLASGVYTVGPGSQGVVRQFGREVSKTGAGLNYHLPWPIQRATVVDLAVVRRVNIGFQETSPGRFTAVESEALMLTRDENIVDVHMIVQYRVVDASGFLFNVRNVPDVLKTAAEVSLRGVVGSTLIDDVLTERRAEVQDLAKAMLQGLMEGYRAGIVVTEVKLQEVDAPKQVRDAFHEVVRAREDRERLVREAEGYQADVVPRARGEKERTIQAAEAYKEQRVLRSQGDAEKFLEVLAEYEKAPAVTRQRIYLETLENLLAGTNKIIIDPETVGNVLPFLPLTGVSGLPQGTEQK